MIKSTNCFCFRLALSVAVFVGLAVSGVTSGRGLRQEALPALPDPAEGRQVHVCDDSCNLARNGVCEEGRRSLAEGPAGSNDSSVRAAYCDLGTDCADCGPWLTRSNPVPWAEPNVPGPVRLLRAMDVQVFVRHVALPGGTPAFAFAHTDGKKDVGVSRDMDQGQGIVESSISKIFYRVLKDRCVGPGGSRALVVDVGANFGWFAILAARLGCRVIAYEPVPLFRWFLEYNLHLNDLSHRVHVRAAAVSNQPSTAVRMVVPSTGIWGTAGLGGLNIDHAIEGKKEEINVPSVRLEDEVQEDVLLMKVDVEGWEWAVMQGAEGLLSKHSVENIVMEYSPGVPERHVMVEEEMETVRMLVRFMQRGYRIGHIGSGTEDPGDWSEPMHPMREVTLDNLKYDMTDLRMWKNRTLGCPPREELAQYAVWASCNQIPEDLSPRSFRATFQHNTNVWVARGASLEGQLELSGDVGVVDLHAPPSRWMSTTGDNTGLGSAWCDMDPVWQVRSRCPCTHPALCGEEQAIVEGLAAQGLIASNYVLKETAEAVLGLASELREVA